MKKINFLTFTFSLFIGQAFAQLYVNQPTNFNLNPIAKSIAFGDIDGDGDFDAFSVEPSSDSVEFWLNTGSPSSPSFVKGPSSFGLTGPAWGLELADLDNDGDLDAFTVYPAGPCKYWQNNGSANSPSFVDNSTDLGINYSYRGIDFVDIDNDGDKDAYLIYDTNSGSDFYLNVGSSSSPVFSGGLNTAINTQGYSVDFTDVDNDGDMDCFSGGYFFINTGSPSSPAFTNSNPILNYGLTSSGQVRFVDIDADGDTDAFDIDLGFSEYYERVLGTGIKTVSSDTKPLIIPNPFSNTAKINIDVKSGNSKMTIFSCTGAIVQVLFNPTEIGNLPKGLYMYSLEENSAPKSRGRFVVE